MPRGVLEARRAAEPCPGRPAGHKECSDMVGGHCPAHWGMPDAHRFAAAHRGPAQDADTAREHQGEKADTAAQQDDLDTAAPDIAAKTCPDTAVRIGPGIAAMASQRSTDAATADASAGAERSCAELVGDCSDAGPSIRREAGPARGRPQRPRRHYVPRLCRPCSSPLSCSAPAALSIFSSCLINLFTAPSDHPSLDHP